MRSNFAKIIKGFHNLSTLELDLLKEVARLLNELLKDKFPSSKLKIVADTHSCMTTEYNIEWNFHNDYVLHLSVEDNGKLLKDVEEFIDIKYKLLNLMIKTYTHTKNGDTVLVFNLNEIFKILEVHNVQ